MDLDDLQVDNAYALGGPDDERERSERAELLEVLERKKRMRKMAVPTDDGKVRERLRLFGEPITLFGEGPGDRRDRLKYVQEQIQLARGTDAVAEIGGDESSDSGEEESEFYTEGSNALLEARRKIARYSLSRAKKRIARQKQEVGLPVTKIVNVRKEVYTDLKTFNNLGSQFGDDRPLSTIRFSPNSQLVLTASWTGTCKIWDIPNLNLVSTKRGHSDRIGGAAWHPSSSSIPSSSSSSSDPSSSSSMLDFATGGGEGDIKLWNLNSEKPLASLSGHSGRVGRINFHPSGRYLGSAGFDGTWRLWDVVTQKELLIQEGHSKEVYALAFQDDGALVASGGFDAIGRVWDLRTGRTTMILQDHVKEILSMDFAPNGYQIATGSGDDTVRIWDLRTLKPLYTIPAHKSSVSDLKFFRAESENPFTPIDLPSTSKLNGSHSTNSTNGHVEDQDMNGDKSEIDVKPPMANLQKSGLYLVTAGFDNTVRIWSADEWSLIRNLPTDAGKVMSVDVSSNGKFLGSASYSRSFHLFGGDKSL